MKLIFTLCAVFGSLIGAKVYIYKLLSRLLCASTWRKCLIIILCVLFCAEVCFWILVMARSHGFSYIVCSLSVVITYCLFLACLIIDVILLIWRLSLYLIRIVRNIKRNITHATSHDTSSLQAAPTNRRAFLQMLRSASVCALFASLFHISRNNALSLPQTRFITLPLEHLTEPKRIAMVSDIHIGPVLKGDFLRAIVEQINSLHADVVVIVGDLVDDAIQHIKQEFSALESLQSKEGVFYVNGNHEYYHGINAIMDFLSTSNMRVLENESIELSGFTLAGVNDLAGLRFGRPPDIHKASINHNPFKPSILLAHQPKFVREFDVSAFDLVLSGHTHAGQVFPLALLVWLDQHFVHGLYKLSEKTRLYVSSGAGFWGPSFRFLAPSEIVCLDLMPS